MNKRNISKQTLEEKPYELWNLFVDFLVNEDPSEMNDIQLVAYYAFWYDSELNNGGHAQYFDNHSETDPGRVSEALKKLSAGSFSSIHDEAFDVYQELESTKDKNIAEDMDIKLQELDSKFYQTQPTIQVLLEKYLDEKRDEFIEIE